MDHSSQPTYERIDPGLPEPSKYEDGGDGDDLDLEDDELLHDRSSARHSRQLCSGRTSKILASVNIFLTVALLGVWIATGLWFGSHELVRAPKPPYSPLREDGYIEYVNKRFKPQRVFQQEEGEELEAAWNATLGPSDGIIRLTEDKVDKLTPTAEIYYEPGQYIYGVSVFHQLHCLNIIRKSFYPEKFFPSKTDDFVKFHKNHCIDFLRQSIICSGDTSLTYWWNKNYTYRDEKGEEHYTQWYLDMTPKERAYNTWLMWDVEHQCHNLDLITEWVGKHQLRDDAYIRAIENKEDFIAGIHDDE